LLTICGGGESGVEILYTTNTDALHPGEIQGDPVLSDVAIHPVPPDTGARAIRRIVDPAWRAPMVADVGDSADEIAIGQK
jgi:hypothetical protein